MFTRPLLELYSVSRRRGLGEEARAVRAGGGMRRVGDERREPGRGCAPKLQGGGPLLVRIP